MDKQQTNIALTAGCHNTSDWTLCSVAWCMHLQEHRQMFKALFKSYLSVVSRDLASPDEQLYGGGSAPDKQQACVRLVCVHSNNSRPHQRGLKLKALQHLKGDYLV